MLFVFNKNKITSYVIATSIVMILFLVSISFIPNTDAKLVQISSNIVNNVENNNLKNDNTDN